MTEKKKHQGTKARIRAERERDRRIATTIFLASILLIVIIPAYFSYTFLNHPQSQTVNSEPSQLKAAIVDQLSLSIPNQTFVDASTTILEEAGYVVDYYKGEKVTVDFYRNLATHGYSLIILRVHSALGSTNNPPLALFTSEIYTTTKYISEQWNDQVTRVFFNSEIYKDSNYYFGVLPDFIKQRMNGKFDNTVIIMMGCDGITYLGGNYRYVGMAKAFIERGAKVYISWSGPVLGSYSDEATINLLQNLIKEKQTIRKAIENTMMKIGSDPMYKSVLQFYPREAENDVVFPFTSGLIINVAETKKYDSG